MDVGTDAARVNALFLEVKLARSRCFADHTTYDGTLHVVTVVQEKRRGEGRGEWVEMRAWMRSAGGFLGAQPTITRTDHRIATNPRTPGDIPTVCQHERNL